MTLLDLLDAALARAAAVTPGEQTPPVAVLWPDPDSAFAPLLPAMRARWPALLELGDYAPEMRRGPALWLRCAVDRTLRTSPLPDGALPILYLPGVTLALLRTPETLPERLLPLAELPYRGTVVHQENGRDLTPLSVLSAAKGGAGLDIARDTATADALARALSLLATEDLAVYRGQRLDAAFLDALLISDTPREILRWLDDPDAFRTSTGAGRWEAFSAVLRTRYAVDPERDGVLAAAAKLGKGGDGAWDSVWDRFAEAPQRYTALPDRLAAAAPTTPGLFAASTSRWPTDNATAEDELRAALVGIGTLGPRDAADRLRTLDAHHGPRRDLPWADLGSAPLACALACLIRLADATAAPPVGATLAEIATAYAATGWHADDALLTALAAADREADLTAVVQAAGALYRPWAEALATRVQAHAAAVPTATVHPVEDGTAYLFVDGLRLDVANRLCACLQRRGRAVSLATGWAALPTVTATAKAAASPAAPALGPGNPDGAAFSAGVAGTGTDLTSPRFRKALADAGVTFLTPTETGTGAGCAWTETGIIDSAGHDTGLRLAHALPDIVNRLTDRVEALSGAGWARVRVVTDHGWLLVPGGLPKASLDRILAANRWGRCATLKSGSDASGTAAVVVPWHWDPSVRVALAPGISAFTEGYVYAHGGLTLQEAIVPILTLERGGAAPDGQRPVLAEAVWRGLRLRLRLDPVGRAVRAEVRVRAADPATAVGGADLKPDGSASLIVEDDTLDQTAAVLVLLDAAGTVQAQHPVTIGD